MLRCKCQHVRKEARTGPLFRDRVAVSPIGTLALTAFAAIAATVSQAAVAQGSPDIRLHDANQVPACVTPDRLMAFLKRRNRNLIPRFSSIAKWYQLHGDRWQVRWDYAFFQMAVETNFLTYRTGRGRMGDVDPAQNNFAGLGTTGGGVPGDSFPDVSSGVLGQIQHLVAYSGERLDDPVAPRTQLKQDHIIALSQKLGRRVAFADLSRRWAVDPKYDRSIEWVANQYRKQYCRNRQANSKPSTEPSQAATADRPRPPKPSPTSAASKVVRTIWRRADARKVQVPDTMLPAEAEENRDDPTPYSGLDFGQTALLTPQIRSAPLRRPQPLARPSRLGTQPTNCSIQSASYGGSTTVLLRSASAIGLRLTALSVFKGFENSMIRNFQKTHAPGSDVIGTFDTTDHALREARTICHSMSVTPPKLVRNGMNIQ
jgi:hypothetical protein